MWVRMGVWSTWPRRQTQDRGRVAPLLELLSNECLDLRCEISRGRFCIRKGCNMVLLRTRSLLLSTLMWTWRTSRLSFQMILKVVLLVSSLLVAVADVRLSNILMRGSQKSRLLSRRCGHKHTIYLRGSFCVKRGSTLFFIQQFKQGRIDIGKRRSMQEHATAMLKLRAQCHHQLYEWFLDDTSQKQPNLWRSLIVAQ